MAVTLQELQKKGINTKYPRFKAGQTVRVYEKIKEGTKERIQIFEGLIIQIGGTGIGKTLTVRKIIGGIGVEKIFSIYSPVIDKIEITKEAKVRRGRLFFMRERRGKSARLKEKFMVAEKFEDKEVIEENKEVVEETEVVSEDLEVEKKENEVEAEKV